MRKHFSRVKGRCPCRGPAARRWSCEARNLFFAKHEIFFLRSTKSFFCVARNLFFAKHEIFFCEARNLFLRSTKSFLRSTKSFLRSTKSFLRSTKSFLRSTKSFLRSTKSFLRRKIFILKFYQDVSPVGRPACSAGPKQVTDLHRACGSYFFLFLIFYT